ncbi:hypothetical protein SCHPADRAFT_817390 [Schizopora paradoxa]|uniref:Hepatocellular carcinoma-associated antigen 59-domain-containing protein n=1 Tax=Schizopora paradoxa TaxID=27342 RepID=A0A0H2S6M5_9AGAM|nr:hypothetical protein SCHPADRAFT_817390 [Schizopora paradoxa]
MIKKRSRPTARVRVTSPEFEEKAATSDTPDDEKNLPLEDILELRRLRRARQGIDVAKLNKGDVKKKKKKGGEGEGAASQAYGLNSARKETEDDEWDSKARKAVRQSNFTQQTNALDVDRHMMAYIEENLKLRRGGQNKDEEGSSKPYDPKEELFKLPEEYKTQNLRAPEEGNVMNSISMLAAIPEVDLGMDTRLKNIEETEKAKRMVADSRKDMKRQRNDEEHLVATRFFKPNTRQKSDADIIRDAKLDAMGLRAEDHEPRQHRERVQTATDEIVMERFKKRMRK